MSTPPGQRTLTLPTNLSEYIDQIPERFYKKDLTKQGNVERLVQETWLLRLRAITEQLGINNKALAVIDLISTPEGTQALYQEVKRKPELKRIPDKSQRVWDILIQNEYRKEPTLPLTIEIARITRFPEPRTGTQVEITDKSQLEAAVEQVIKDLLTIFTHVAIIRRPDEVTVFEIVGLAPSSIEGKNTDREYVAITHAQAIKAINEAKGLTDEEHLLIYSCAMRTKGWWEQNSFPGTPEPMKPGLTMEK